MERMAFPLAPLLLFLFCINLLMKGTSNRNKAVCFITKQTCQHYHSELSWTT